MGPVLKRPFTDLISLCSLRRPIISSSYDGNIFNILLLKTWIKFASLNQKVIFSDHMLNLLALLLHLYCILRDQNRSIGTAES